MDKQQPASSTTARTTSGGGRSEITFPSPSILQSFQMYAQSLDKLAANARVKEDKEMVAALENIPDSVEAEVIQHIQNLQNPAYREEALLELSKCSKNYPQEIAPLLWHSFGTMAILIQEVVALYPYLAYPDSGVLTISSRGSNRVCNCLALLQSVAGHVDTRMLFLKAQIGIFLYPYLECNIRVPADGSSRHYEYLKLTSLGVIGALVKVDNEDLPAIIQYLINMDIPSMCLKVMANNLNNSSHRDSEALLSQNGSELQKSVSTFIMHKILLDEKGLQYICGRSERFFGLTKCLDQMLQQQRASKQPSVRLLKHVIRCYLRLLDDPRAKKALAQCLPEWLCVQSFQQALASDESGQTALFWKNLLQRLDIELIRDSPQPGGLMMQ